MRIRVVAAQLRLVNRHGRGEPLQDTGVTFHLCGAVCDLRVERFRAHHFLFQIQSIDGGRQIRLSGKIP